jgi:raffinose/stachyose/melibiose transport system substrate-binding protein
VVAYNKVLTAQLKDGTGPDIFYLTSYSLGRDFYNQGYLEPLDDLPGLKENFAPTMREAWATDDGLPYGVPFIATSPGIYYNKNIFAKLGLTVPETWEELLTTAQTIKEAGYIPFANASANDWDIAESVFMNVAPNFIGGREGRMEYLTGNRCFNDNHVVAAFQAVKDLVPYFPKNHKLFTYYDSQQLFLQGQAAMWMQGSWDIPFFEASDPPFEWSVFAPPPPAGQPAYITFHLDAGVGLNAASPYKEEARVFLEWMTTPEFGAMFGNELPGLFPMHTNVPILDNKHANDFLKLNQDRGTDIRFPWQKLTEGSPDGYTLMLEGAMAVVRNTQTPQEAADSLQAGLAKWFEPARTCRK